MKNFPNDKAPARPNLETIEKIAIGLAGLLVFYFALCIIEALEFVN